MKKMIPVLIVLAVFAIAPMLAVADDPAPAADQVDLEAAKTVFENTCSKCHDLGRPLGKTKDQAGWEKTVTRMSDYHKRFGGPIPDEDQTAIVQYLLERAGK